LAGKLLPCVVGGKERQDSVAAGMASLPPEVELVAVHDAARCLVERESIEEVLDCGDRYGAALVAVRTRDTIKRVRDSYVVETPPRDECWAAQTPQVFHFGILREALAKARAEGVMATDDAQLVELLGAKVRIVEGRARNMKITLPEDLAVAEQWLAASTLPTGAGPKRKDEDTA
jgi:2-C-methyl-D-erythritol 4-phosphate cytidylyltransferase